MRKITLLAALTAALTLGSAFAQTTLLNVSYDPTRELYETLSKVVWAKALPRVSAAVNAASRVILRIMNSSHLKSR